MTVVSRPIISFSALEVRCCRSRLLSHFVAHTVVSSKAKLLQQIQELTTVKNELTSEVNLKLLYYLYSKPMSVHVVHIAGRKSSCFIGTRTLKE